VTVAWPDNSSAAIFLAVIPLRKLNLSSMRWPVTFLALQRLHLAAVEETWLKGLRDILKFIA
jgi:hypothetical protein